MADRIFFWKSVDAAQADCFGIYQGSSDDLVGLLHSSKVAANISITDVTNGVLSEYGWQNGMMGDEPLTIHVDGVYCTAGGPRNSRGSAERGKGKKQKIAYDEDGNVIEKPPRKLSPYNLFVKDQIPLLKEQYPHLKHNEIFAKVGELWKLSKETDQDDEEY